MFTLYFSFKNYSKASTSVLLYDASKRYEPFANDYLDVLSHAIEHMERGQTSTYINIFDDVDLEQYYDIDNGLLEQTMYGYIAATEDLTNEQWFRILKSVIINYKILVLVFSECDMNVHDPSYDMAANSEGFSIDLKQGTAAVLEKYVDYLPEGVDTSTWPVMRTKELSSDFLEIELEEEEDNSNTDLVSVL